MWDVARIPMYNPPYSMKYKSTWVHIPGGGKPGGTGGAEGAMTGVGTELGTGMGMTGGGTTGAGAMFAMGVGGASANS